MSWDEYPSGFRRRCGFPFFGNWAHSIDEIMSEMEESVQNMLKEFGNDIPESFLRELKLSDGTTFREMGPFVWGWTMTMGPERKPIIREFGNLKTSIDAKSGGTPLKLREEREPLIDIREDDKKIRVIAELPGVEKSDIKLSATERTLLISVDTKERKYYKELELPNNVEPSKTRASYNNGVLEVELRKVEDKRSVRIELE